MVSKSPLPFAELPRQAGGMPAEPVTADGPIAAAIDADFDVMKTWSDPFHSRLKVIRGSSALGTVFAPGWTWYSTAGLYCDTLAVGDVRFFSVLVKYTGATLTADDYGGIDNKVIGTFKDPLFKPTGGRHLNFSGSTTVGTAIYIVSGAGELQIAGLSYKNVQFKSGHWACVNGMFIPTGGNI